MDTDVKRRLVSPEQLQTLVDFMRDHPQLAKGLSRGRRGKLMTVKVWNACAKKLNSMKDGAVKDGKGWSKYWCDWKYRVRRHALELRVARVANKPPPEGVNELSPLEENIMSIIGDTSLDEVLVKTDTLVDEDSEQDDIKNETEPKLNIKRNTRRKRRVSPVAVVNNADDYDDGRDSPPRQRARLEDSDESDWTNVDTVTRRFLQLEERRLETSLKMQDSLHQLVSATQRVANSMENILDAILRTFNNTT